MPGRAVSAAARRAAVLGVAAAVGLVEDGVVFVGGVVEGLAVVVDEGGPAEYGADVGVLLQVLQLRLQYLW